MTALIEADLPDSWQELEEAVARILVECGYDVELHKTVKLARGDVDIDVWADDHSRPPNVIAVECKLWSTPVPKTVVHSFRTVVGDSGANVGLVVSSAGFQEGAVKAAAYSTVRLLDWAGFQEMFIERWFTQFMLPRLAIETDPLQEYTEPINSRIFRKADELAPGRQEQFKVLRKLYLPLAGIALGFRARLLDLEGADSLSLPLRPTGGDLSEFGVLLPDDILDAKALRPLMDALIEHSRDATAEFDDVFGSRA